jgi:hypothetical protein
LKGSLAVPSPFRVSDCKSFCDQLTVTGRLDPAKATASEIAGEKLFFGKAQCSTCHPAPFYLDNQMHDLHVERFLKNEAGDGPIKAFTLRGIKDSPGCKPRPPD